MAKDVLKEVNEFRQDLVSGDWVLFATGRAGRPSAERPGADVNASLRTSEPDIVSGSDANQCPFDDLRASGNEIVSEYEKSNKEKWVTVIKNKYPAVVPLTCAPIESVGPFSHTAANGFHEVVVTKDHQRNFPDFTLEETALVLKAYRDRYLDIAQNECGSYIQIFNNSGKEAGASVLHPHSQILSTPILPPTVSRSINGSAKFFKKNKKRIHGAILDWEIEQKKRIVFENNLFIAFCPFTSKRSYETRIFPKIPSARFEVADGQNLESCAEVLNFCLSQLKKIFKDNFNFNFFIHTAPVREDSKIPSSEFYHWHIEVIPHYSALAGFDFSTGIIVNTIDPDKAAEEIRHAS